MFDPSQINSISEQDINLLVDYLSLCGKPKKIHELRKEYVRHKLIDTETQYWAPDKIFDVGASIIVFVRDSNDAITQRKGTVIYIQNNCRDDLGFGGPKFRYDKICVQFDHQRHYYVSNCNELNSYIEKANFDNKELVNEIPFITPESLPIALAETIDPILINELLNDSRFIHFNDEWCLQSLFSFFGTSNNLLEKARDIILLARRPVTINEIITESGFDQTEHIELTRFQLCRKLKEDKLFCFFVEDEEIFWNIASPPAKAVNKIEQYTIEKGIIRVTQGVRKLIANIGLYARNAPIPFRIKGNYLIHGVFDGDGYIQSGEISEWINESLLISGDHIYLAIDEDQSSLRLFSQYDVEKRTSTKDLIEPEEDIEPKSTQISLRDKVFIILKQANSFLHYKQIHTEVNNKFQEDDKLHSIGATLSMNRQMFCQGYRMLWGLIEWQGEEYLPDRTAIIFATREDDLVYKFLTQSEQPKSYDELCNYIAEYFGLSMSYIQTSDVLSSEDKRIIRLPDGRFALTEWKALWQLRKSDLERQRQIINEMKERALSINKIIDEVQSKIKILTVIISKLESEIASIQNDHQSAFRQKTLIVKQLRDIVLRIKGSFWIGNFLTIISAYFIQIYESSHYISFMFLMPGFASYMYSWRLTRIRKNLHLNIGAFENKDEMRKNVIDALKREILDHKNNLQLLLDTLTVHINELKTLEKDIENINILELINEIQNVEEQLRLIS